MKTDLIIETVPLHGLVPAPGSLRTVSPEALAELRGPAERFGLVETVVRNRRSGRVPGGQGVNR